MGVPEDEDDPSKWSDGKVVAEMRSDSLINAVRQSFVRGAAAIEQSQGQRRPPSPVEVRRQEFVIARQIIDRVTKGSGIMRPTGGPISEAEEE